MLKRISLLLLLSVVFIADGRADTPRKAADAAAQKLGAANLQPSQVADNLFMFRGRNAGFALVDADGSVIAYSDEAPTAGSLPPGLTEMIRNYASCRSFENRAAKYSPKLLKTPVFAQTSPFNSYLNKHYKHNWGELITGCTGTAMATVMKYYNWPPKGRGEKSYECNGNTYYCNFGQTTFDWENILTDYNDYFTSEQGDAIGLLCYAAAQSVETQFYDKGSGANFSNIADAMRDNFYFSHQIFSYSARNMAGEEWEQRLRAEIDAGRPVIYSGCNADDASMWLNDVMGHAFVLDGYDEQGLFHVNWGWGGLYDGYFALSALKPTPDDDFSKSAGAIFNLTPDRNFTELPRIAVFASTDYHPDHIYGITSDHAYVKKGQYTGIFNFSYKVFGEPFTKSFSKAVALCDAAGNIRQLFVSQNSVVDNLTWINGDGLGGDEYFLSQTDANEGDYLCMMYKGDDMTDWEPMGSIGPTRNYCPAYGYQVPTVPVTWKPNNLVKVASDVYGNRDVSEEEFIHNIVPCSGSWRIEVTADQSVRILNCKINGELTCDKFWRYYKNTDDGRLRMYLAAWSSVRRGDKFEIEFIALTDKDISSTPVTVTGVKPGELEARVKDVADPKSVSKLTVEGRLTDTDFDFMRDHMYALEELDISNITIAEHGYNPEACIPYKGFSDMYYLKKIALPTLLAGFHNNSFANTGLTEVYIPSGATTFGVNVFNSCSKLTKVTVAQTLPAQISWCVFAGSGRPTATLVVPVGSKALYQAHEEWGQFGTIIEDDKVVDGIDDVLAEDPSTNQPVEYFNLSGRKVNAPLAPGFYLRRQGTQTTKVLVK